MGDKDVDAQFADIIAHWDDVAVVPDRPAVDRPAVDGPSVDRPAPERPAHDVFVGDHVPVLEALHGVHAAALGIGDLRRIHALRVIVQDRRVHGIPPASSSPSA